MLVGAEPSLLKAVDKWGRNPLYRAEDGAERYRTQQRREGCAAVAAFLRGAMQAARAAADGE